jgi:hypothetical protein
MWAGPWGSCSCCSSCYQWQYISCSAPQGCETRLRRVQDELHLHIMVGYSSKLVPVACAMRAGCRHANISMLSCWGCERAVAAAAQPGAYNKRQLAADSRHANASYLQFT